MKVLYVITRSDVIGGASVHVLDLASGMQKAGNEVFILVGGNGVFKRIASERGISCCSLKSLVRDINLLKDFFGFFELRKKIKNISPDIVHLHSSKAGILGRLACKSLGIPVVFTAHGWAFTEGISSKKRAFYQFIERVMARFSDRIITVSNYDKDLALKLGVGSDDLISVVHNGMPDIPLKCVSDKRSKGVRLIMVARFDEQKDHATLLRAVSSLKEFEWTLELVGSGPLLESSKKLAEQVGVSGRVSFPDACSDVPDRLAASNVFLLISNWEGLPLTILEAMRAGLPVVASSVGGIPETIDHQKTGLLVPRNDEQSIRSALKEMFQSDELRLSMGRHGREKFERQFTFEGMLNKTLLIYSEVLGREL